MVDAVVEVAEIAQDAAAQVLPRRSELLVEEEEKDNTSTAESTPINQ